METAQSPFVRTPEAARYLGLSTRTLEGMRIRGGGPLYRHHGRIVVYAVSDLRAWSDAQARIGTRQPARRANPAQALGAAGRGKSKRRGGRTRSEVSAYMRALAERRKHPGRKKRE